MAQFKEFSKKLQWQQPNSSKQVRQFVATQLQHVCPTALSCPWPGISLVNFPTSLLRYPPSLPRTGDPSKFKFKFGNWQTRMIMCIFLWIIVYFCEPGPTLLGFYPGAGGIRHTLGMYPPLICINISAFIRYVTQAVAGGVGSHRTI